MSINTYGPTFRWFAWHPVWTVDRGWRWLRNVNRRRCHLDITGSPSFWVDSVS